MALNELVKQQLPYSIVVLGKIVNKYHYDLDPKMKDNSVCLTYLAKVFKHKVASEQETDVRRHYLF